MNVERTIEFILQMQAKAEVEIAAIRQRQAKADAGIAATRQQQAKADAKAKREMAAIRTLIRAGMKLIAKNSESIKELTKSQKVTDAKFQALMDSMRRGGNGHRNN